jgi:DHA1 family bicyclomycin/chloramphenicol resistance-like MFS transporter
VLLSGLAIFFAGTIAALLAQTFLGLLAARLVQGIGAASPRIIRRRCRARSLRWAPDGTRHVVRHGGIHHHSGAGFGQALIHLGDWHWTFYVLLAMASAGGQVGRHQAAGNRSARTRL